jgi:hypothetical protein
MDVFDLSGVPVDALVQELGNMIVQSVQEDWETASLYAEIEDDEGGAIYGRYTTRDSTDESLMFDTGSEAYLIFEELRRRMEKPGAPMWTVARFTVKRDGSFNLDVSYPDSPRTLGPS